MEAAAAYVEARARGGTTPAAVVAKMDAAQEDLKRAKRRLEQTQRRLAKHDQHAHA
jgi:hypothetical protein